MSETAAERARREEEANDRNAVATVMGTPQGRRFAMMILDDCHWSRPVLNENPFFTYHNVGLRKVADGLWSRLSSIAPDRLGDMLKEDEARKERLRTKKEKGERSDGPQAPVIPSR